MLFIGFQDNRLLQRMASFQASAMGWPASPGMATPTVIKKVIRLDVPVEKFPNVSKKNIYHNSLLLFTNLF